MDLGIITDDLALCSKTWVGKKKIFLLYWPNMIIDIYFIR